MQNICFSLQIEFSSNKLEPCKRLHWTYTNYWNTQSRNNIALQKALHKLVYEVILPHIANLSCVINNTNADNKQDPLIRIWFHAHSKTSSINHIAESLLQGCQTKRKKNKSKAKFLQSNPFAMNHSSYVTGTRCFWTFLGKLLVNQHTSVIQKSVLKR